MKPLLSPAQLASVQKVALAGMATDVTFKRRTHGSNDLGDEAFDANPVTVAVVKGYLRETGGDVVGGIDVAKITTTSTYDLAVPLGTAVRARDIAVIGGREFIVSNVHDDETWPGMLSCVIRRGE